MILFFPLAATDITVEAIISDHLFSLVGDMGVHGRQPFERVKYFLIFAIFRLIVAPLFYNSNRVDIETFPHESHGGKSPRQTYPHKL